MAVELGKLPEVRELEDSELQELRQAAKFIEDDVVFHDDKNHSRPGRKWVANVDVYVEVGENLSFDVSSVMELELRVNIGGEQDFWYRVLATRQMVHMFHNAPGHLGGGILIDGQHKHPFDRDIRPLPGYVPDPSLGEDLSDAVRDFLAEENISFEGEIKPALRSARLETFNVVRPQ